MVPGAGHYPQAEFPEVVSPAVVEFALRVESLRDLTHLVEVLAEHEDAAARDV